MAVALTPRTTFAPRPVSRPALGRQPASARRRSARPSPVSAARHRVAALVVLAIVGSFAALVLAGMHHARSGPASLDGAGSGAGATVAVVGAPVAAAVHVVQPGDTLWTIARALQPSGDIRPLVHRLQSTVGGRALQPGQRVLLPPAP